MLTQHQTETPINQQYKILRILGKGGMGTTYAAQHLETKEIVALKAISLQSLTDAKQLELLEREINTLKNLDHPNIPRYLDYFEVDDSQDKTFYIVQQLAEGKNLAQWVQEGWRVTEKEIKTIAIQLLEILNYLHNLEPPIIHRDIKPHNIIRSAEGKLFLVDFGSVQNTYYSTFMGGNTTVGTFGYMPIEQASGKAVPASDLYSLGATLLYLLTHRSPSELSEDGLTIDFRSHINVSEELADWLEKMLEPEVEERFKSAQEALDALQKPQLIKEGKLSKKWGALWLGMGLVILSGIYVFNNYKGAITHKLGYPYTKGVCEDREVTLHYLSTGGKLDVNLDREMVYCFNWAIDNNDKDMVELFFEQGATVNFYNFSQKTGLERSKILPDKMYSKIGLFDGDNGNQPLIFAVKKGDYDMVELLINNGADVTIKGGDEGIFYKNRYYGKGSPLDIAALSGNKDIVELLVNNGAEINSLNYDHKMALHLAVENEHEEVVEFLIAQGADINAKVESDYSVSDLSEEGYTPLHLAAKYSNINIIKLLIAQGADIDAKSEYGYTPLHLAATNGNVEIVKWLVIQGAKINIESRYGDTLLHSAARNEDVEVIKWLTAQGIDINAKSKNGNTPLHLAAKNRNVEVVKWLVTQGANINAKTKSNQTPLHFAAEYGNVQIIKWLVTQGANINAKTKSDKTPLHFASQRGDNEIEEIVGFLIANGADVNSNYPSLNTPLQQAHLRNNHKIVNLLKKHGAK